MTDIARLRFRSMSAPSERGNLVLSDEGTFRIDPSEQLRDQMAHLEESAVRKSRMYGMGVGISLIVLGSVAVGIGWIAGRVFGKLGSTLSEPRPVENVNLARTDAGALRLTLRGLESRFQTIQMAWNPDEYLQPEADAFLQKLEEMKGNNTGH